MAGGQWCELSRPFAVGPRVTESRPLIFLDIDDVLCLNDPYGGYDLLVKPYPPDLWQKLFSPEAASTLLDIVREHCPRIVLTSSWMRILQRDGFEGVFRATGLAAVAESLHQRWDAPEDKGMSRLHAIERWLAKSHLGEPYVVLDDQLSGTGLVGSPIDRAGRLVVCDVAVGLKASHVHDVRRALLK